MPAFDPALSQESYFDADFFLDFGGSRLIIKLELERK